MDKFLKGEILTADKLNQLVAELNNLSADSLITGSSTVSAQSDYSTPRFVKPDFTDMHDTDGVPVILDQLQGVDCQGLFARNIEATTYTTANRQQNKNLVKLSSEVKGSQNVYQRITTDSKGQVTRSDVVLFDICSDNMPTATLPNYEKGQGGTIYRRLARIAANCRIEGVSDPSQAYKVISTPEANLPPFVSNEKGTCGFALINSLDGNTLPVKRIKAGDNITIKDCGASLVISASGTTGGNCDCNDCNDCNTCTCSIDYVGCQPIVVCGNTIRLDYNQCHFNTISGQLTLSCNITSKLDQGATCYSFQRPLHLASGNNVQLCYDDGDFITCNNKLYLKNTPLKGVVDSSGNLVSWYELSKKTVPLFYFYIDCTEVSIGAGYKDGYLRLFGINS